MTYQICKETYRLQIHNVGRVDSFYISLVFALRDIVCGVQ
jgi:hypothetical protein